MRVAITGAGGQLGRQLVAAFAASGEVVPLSRDELDLADPEAGRRLADARPDVVMNAAAWTDVDGCAADPDRAMELNGAAPGRLAAAAAGSGALFVQVSTNEVFDGESSSPYDEDAEPRPINPYGASKLAGERAVAAAAPRHLIVRTAWLFGPGSRNFATKILAAARAADERGEAIRVVDDEHGNPTWTPALAEAIVAAVTLAARGAAPPILHLAGEPATTRFGWAERILELHGNLRPPDPVAGSAFSRPSKVPPRAVLSTERAARLGLPRIDWQAVLPAYVASLRATG
jgi:dTDP-4-dehydrorhamnose reductase